MVVLAQPDIRRAVENREVVFDPPIEDRQWGEASVDLRLGRTFTKLTDAPGAVFSLAEGLSTIGRSGLWAEQILEERDKFGKRPVFVLEPDEFVLALTHERITVPKHLIGLVEGRSTYARVGLTMHQTAPWIQPGWTGHITLEIRNSGPLRIALTPVIDMPCQLTFLRLSSPLSDDEAYGSRPTDVYQNQTSVLPKSTNGI